MTPKEKAKELVDKFYQEAPLDEIKFYSNNVMAKSCALIAVDEMQQLIKDLSSCKNRFIYIIDEMNYWNEVKQEIDNL